MGDDASDYDFEAEAEYINRLVREMLLGKHDVEQALRRAYAAGHAHGRRAAREAKRDG